MRLKGKVAVVTGAARGIGRAIALRLGHEGARVAVVDVLEDQGYATVRLIQDVGGQAMFVPTDVSDAARCKPWWIRWSGSGAPSISWSTTPESARLRFSGDGEALWDRVLDINLKGYFLCSQAVARVMVEQGVKGRIIAVSSISSEFGGSSQAHYCASKAGINLLVKSMAISLGPYGITCNAVLPAPSRPTLTGGAGRSGRARLLVEASPLGRLGQPEDVAGRSSSLPATTQTGAPDRC